MALRVVPFASLGARLPLRLVAPRTSAGPLSRARKSRRTDTGSPACESPDALPRVFGICGSKAPPLALHVHLPATQPGRAASRTIGNGRCRRGVDGPCSVSVYPPRRRRRGSAAGRGHRALGAARPRRRHRRAVRGPAAHRRHRGSGHRVGHHGLRLPLAGRQEVRSSVCPSVCVNVGSEPCIAPSICHHLPWQAHQAGFVTQPGVREPGSQACLFFLRTYVSRSVCMTSYVCMSVCKTLVFLPPYVRRSVGLCDSSVCAASPGRRP
jgi:hypothetical protein